MNFPICISRSRPISLDVRPSLWRSLPGASTKSSGLVEHWVGRLAGVHHNSLGFGSMTMNARRPIWMWLSQSSPKSRRALWTCSNFQFFVFGRTPFQVWPKHKCDWGIWSYFERGPVEFVELKIWASSESSPGFGRALWSVTMVTVTFKYRVPSVHLQDWEFGPSPIELWRTPTGRRLNAQLICRILGWPRAVNAISLAGHLRAPAEFLFHGKVRARWRHSAGLALLGTSCQRGAKLLEKLAALQLRLKVRRGVSDS